MNNRLKKTSTITKKTPKISETIIHVYLKPRLSNIMSEMTSLQVQQILSNQLFWSF